MNVYQMLQNTITLKLHFSKKIKPYNPQTPPQTTI